MWMFAEIVDRTGSVVARAEGEVVREGDLSEISRRAVDRFHQSFPGQSLLSGPGDFEFILRYGRAEKF